MLLPTGLCGVMVAKEEFIKLLMEEKHGSKF